GHNSGHYARAGGDAPALAQTAIVSWTLPLRLLLGHLAAVGRAAALALARVLALAAVIAGLATALALAAVLALTGVLFFRFLVRLGFVLRGGGRSLPREARGLDSGAGAREQARDRRTGEQVFIRLCHFPNVLLNELTALHFRQRFLPEDRLIP